MAVAAQVAEGINIVLQLRNLRKKVLDFAEDVPSGNENHLHISMVKNILVVILADGGIDGHVDGS